MSAESAIRIRAVDWTDAAGETLRAAQRAEIAERYGTWESEPGPAPTAADITVFLVAFAGDESDAEPLACGGLRAIDAEHGEVKRMYVSPGHRGSGVAALVLRALEYEARARGWTRLVLETGTEQPDAVRFYQREGYTPIPLFGHYSDSAASLCFGRDL